MDPINPLHTEFYDNPACSFDEPHTIPEGWDAEALLRSVSAGHSGGTVEGRHHTTPQPTEKTGNAKNPVS